MIHSRVIRGIASALTALAASALLGPPAAAEDAIYTVSSGWVRVAISPDFLDAVGDAGATLSALPPARLVRSPQTGRTVLTAPVDFGTVMVESRGQTAGVVGKGGLRISGNGRSIDLPSVVAELTSYRGSRLGSDTGENEPIMIASGRSARVPAPTAERMTATSPILRLDADLRALLRPAAGPSLLPAPRRGMPLGRVTLVLNVSQGALPL